MVLFGLKFIGYPAGAAERERPGGQAKGADEEK